MTPKRNVTDPNSSEQYKDMLFEVRTIPAGWDLSAVFASSAYADHQINGTAYDYTSRQDNERTSTQNPA